MVTARRTVDPVEMRRRLVEATVSCLVEFGYAGTTTLRVQQRAGVSRGALLHHFPSKPALLVAAVRSVAEQQGVRMRALVEEREPGPDRVRFAIDVLREGLSGPLYLAGHELWMAARTDESLRAVLGPYERAVGRVLREIGAQAFGPDYATLPGFEVAFEALLELLRGAAITGVLRPDTSQHERVLAAWAEVFPALCAAGARP